MGAFHAAIEAGWHCLVLGEMDEALRFMDKSGPSIARPLPRPAGFVDLARVATGQFTHSVCLSSHIGAILKAGASGHATIQFMSTGLWPF